MSKEALKKAEAELKKLKMMSPMSAEATVVRTYIETLDQPALAQEDQDQQEPGQRPGSAGHRPLRPGEGQGTHRRIPGRAAAGGQAEGAHPLSGGPPGVGKTSLGQSIARATNRKFVRMALGGVRDEAEIRGHRRTYIGSMPGKILQSLTKATVRNPLFLLDEVDKMGQDFRGDPSSALLEVLDPEQNHTFQDHYVEVDYDLSDVMFVATANSLNIPAPLLDRMEVIRLSGYTEDEKINIAQRYLLPKQMKNNGLKDTELHVAESALRDIVRYYTRESGVRSLEREISKICRKAVTAQTLKKAKGKINVTPRNLDKYLGVQRYTYGMAEKNNQVGQVTGLAWTEVGGELLTIEASLMPGKGNITRTGQLGDVMKESIEAARTVMRSRAKSMGINPEMFEKNDMHIHMPEGATPKDGPSAGAAITTAMVSVFTSIPVRCEVAMTGEITLRGEVLPIGGLKEKLLAAHRGGIKKVLIPEGNVKDLVEIPDNIKNRLEIQPVKWIEQVLEAALERAPEALAEEVVGGSPAPVPSASETPAVIKH
jgi:ATP-dependent Lon protease